MRLSNLPSQAHSNSASLLSPVPSLNRTLELRYTLGGDTQFDMIHQHSH